MAKFQIYLIKLNAHGKVDGSTRTNWGNKGEHLFGK